MPIKISLQGLFVLTCLLKLASSGVAYYTKEPWIFGLWVPISFMIAYMVIGYRLRDSDVSLEKFADSCYYLGFIFTIASIIFSLIDLPNIGTNLTDISVRFGAAMVSTVLGLFVRVSLVSFRPSSEDAIRNVEDQVLDASRKLTDEFTRSFEALCDFRGNVMRASQDSVNAVQFQIESMAEEHKAKTTEFFDEMTKHNKEMMLDLMQDVRTTAMGLTRILSEYESTLKITSNRIDATVVQFVKRLVERLNAIEFPDDLFSSRLETSIAQLNESTADVSAGVKLVSTNVLNAAKSVDSSVKRINEKAEGFNQVLEIAREVSNQQKGMVELMQHQQESVVREMGEQQKALIGAVSSQQAALITELRAQLRTLADLNAALGQVDTSMGKIATAITDNQTSADQFSASADSIKQNTSELVGAFKDSVPQLLNVVAVAHDRAEAAVRESQKAKIAHQDITQMLGKLVEINEAYLSANSNSLAKLDHLVGMRQQMDLIADRLDERQTEVLGPPFEANGVLAPNEPAELVIEAQLEQREDSSALPNM